MFSSIKWVLVMAACCAVAQSTNQVILTCGSSTGEKGSTGLPGKMGPPGAQGDVGLTGTKGDKGDSGASPVSRQELDLIIAKLNRSEEALSRLERRVRMEEYLSSTSIVKLTDGYEWYAPGNGFIYLVLPSKMNYDEAKVACRNTQAALASAGIKELNILRKVLNYNRAMFPNDTTGHRTVWIGANDRAREGQWVWEDGSPLLPSQADWKSNEPNGGRRENCMNIFGNKMNDAGCTTSRYSRPLCERPIQI